MAGRGKTPGGAFGTTLAHTGRAGSRRHGFVNPPLLRGSTVLYETMQQRRDAGEDWRGQSLIYGTMGSATHHALEDVVAEIEGGTRCQIVSSGLAAVTTPLLAYLAAGDHLLMPDSAYAPTRKFCDTMLRRLGVETEYYAPEIDEAGITALMRPNTRVLFAESPGSHTFEMQDVPALARVAQAHGAKLLLDNTWGIHHFQPFQHGVDVSIQALTKYVAGHSDLVLGAIVTNSDADWECVRAAALALGQCASPDDCWLALRGARSLGVRLRQQMESGLRVAHWFRAQPEVAEVLHPALPGAPGHDLWRRDFTGACSLFGIAFQPHVHQDGVDRFVEALRLFGIGASWGGYESLALPTTGAILRSLQGKYAGPLCRFHIGLEDPDDLIADLQQAWPHLRTP